MFMPDLFSEKAYKTGIKFAKNIAKSPFLAQKMGVSIDPTAQCKMH